MKFIKFLDCRIHENEEERPDNYNYDTMHRMVMSQCTEHNDDESALCAVISDREKKLSSYVSVKTLLLSLRSSYAQEALQAIAIMDDNGEPTDRWVPSMGSALAMRALVIYATCVYAARRVKEFRTAELNTYTHPYHR
jgi:hypothetical protein